MKIAYHPFSSEFPVNGASLHYSEASRLFAACKGPSLTPAPHDFFRLIASGDRALKAYFSGLSENDVVVCNLGPYAHLYHYLRERYGGRFRIVRDVHTSSAAGYLMQERLCAPLVRPRDLVIFPSQFCRAYYQRLFPGHLHEGNTAVAHPVAHTYPSLPTEKARAPGALRIGYIGRFSDDKNVLQVLDVFAEVARHQTKAELYLAGTFDSQSSLRSAQALQSELNRRSIRLEQVHVFPHLPHRAIWEFFGRIDVLLFLGLSNVESLGRVLIEAQHAGVPVIAADYAAAAEILPSENLVAPVFNTDIEFDTGTPFSWGRVEIDDVLRAMGRMQVGERRSQSVCYRPQSFLKHVLGVQVPMSPPPLSDWAQVFIHSVQLEDEGPQPSFEHLSRLFDAYRRYNDNRFSARWLGLIGTFLRPPSFTLERSLRRQRLKKPEHRLDIIHARAHCAAAGYRSTIKLSGSTCRELRRIQPSTAVL